MKNFIINTLIAVLLLQASTGHAQTVPADSLKKLKGASPEQRAKVQTDLMRDKLQLTASQVQQVSALNLEYARKMEPIIRSDDSRFSKYRKAKPLLEEKENRLKSILTDEQYKKYEDIKKQLMDQARKAAD